MFHIVTLKEGEILRIWLKEQREVLELTQEDAATASGIKRAYYTMIENGTRNPSVDVAKRIAKVMGVEWTIFFEYQCNEVKQ